MSSINIETPTGIDYTKAYRAVHVYISDVLQTSTWKKDTTQNWAEDIKELNK